MSGVESVWLKHFFLIRAFVDCVWKITLKARFAKANAKQDK